MAETTTPGSVRQALHVASLEIRNLRGIREGSLASLAPITVLAGPNNCGKSTVLEAVGLVLAGDPPQGDARAAVRLLLRRGGPPHHALRNAARDPSEPLFAGVDGLSSPRSVKVHVGGPPKAQEFQLARESGLSEPMVQVRVEASRGSISSVLVDTTGRIANGFLEKRAGTESPHTQWVLADIASLRAAGELEDAYSSIRQGGLKSQVIQALATSFDGLEDMETLKVEDSHVLFTFCHGRAIPAYTAGDGLKRFLQIAAALASARQGVALLEEPEAYQHPRYIHELADLLVLSARAGGQIILSTHSIELIDLLLEKGAAESEELVVVSRLALVDGHLSGTVLRAGQALIAREELLKDLRG